MKKYLVVCMVAVTMMFGLMTGMEKHFQTRLRESTASGSSMETMVRSAPEETHDPAPEIFALFGVDGQSGTGRSDCIMLVSYEEAAHTLRMCSIARDTMVNIPGESDRKLAHAYAFGGPEKAIETLNENFSLQITRYAAVDFSQMAQLVDAMGGVSVPLSQGEWAYLDLGDTYLGQKRLSGEEALRYCRIRSLDNDDGRTERQRKLIKAMVEELRTVPRTHLPGLIKDGLAMCSTNIGFPTLLKMGTDVMVSREKVETKSMALPGNNVEAWGGVREDGVWYYVYDLEAASRRIHDFFTGEDGKI